MIDAMIRATRVAVILLCGSSLFLPAHGVESFASQQAVGEWMFHYYEAPSPDKLDSAFLAASKSGLLTRKNATGALVGFLAGALKQHPEQGQKIVDALTGRPANDYLAVMHGIWFSGIPQTEILLQRIGQLAPEHLGFVKHLSARPAPDMLVTPLDSGPWVLDMLWGFFMATGDEAAVVRITSALIWVDEKSDVKKQIIGRAAAWSIKSNALQHPRVLATCREEAARQPGQVGQRLREIIADVGVRSTPK